MDIALFTSGKISKIAISSSDNQKIFSFDSYLLFQNPEKIIDRLQGLVRNLFKKEITKEDRIIFAVAGLIDHKRKTIVISYLLEQLSFSNKFNGFNFSKHFSNVVKPENFILLNDTECVAHGLIQLYKSNKLPANTESKKGYYAEGRELTFPLLLIYIDEGFGMSVIRSLNEVENFERAGSPVESLGGVYPQHYLSSQGVDEMLADNKINIYENYTNKFIEVVKHLINKGIDEGLDFGGVMVYSTKREYLLKDKIHSYFPNKVYFIDPGLYDQMKVGGCFHFFETKGIALKIITSVEYWSSKNKFIKAFYYYQNVLDHWEKAKPIANPENYYLIFFNDNIKLKVPIGLIDFAVEFKRYEWRKPMINDEKEVLEPNKQISTNLQHYFDDGFKKSAIDLILKSGKSALEISTELGVNLQSLRDWLYKYLDIEENIIAVLHSGIVGSVSYFISPKAVARKKFVNELLEDVKDPTVHLWIEEYYGKKNIK